MLISQNSRIHVCRCNIDNTVCQTPWMIILFLLALSILLIIDFPHWSVNIANISNNLDHWVIQYYIAYNSVFPVIFTRLSLDVQLYWLKVCYLLNIFAKSIVIPCNNLYSLTSNKPWVSDSFFTSGGASLEWQVW